MILLFSFCRFGNIYYDIDDNINGYSYFYKILIGESFLNQYCVFIKIEFLLFNKKWKREFYFTEEEYPRFITLWRSFF